jgi:hypothetical protein
VAELALLTITELRDALELEDEAAVDDQVGAVPADRRALVVDLEWDLALHWEAEGAQLGVERPGVGRFQQPARQGVVDIIEAADDFMRQVAVEAVPHPGNLSRRLGGPVVDRTPG